MSDLHEVIATFDVDSLAELRKWFHANKTTPEFQLALKQRHAMAPGVADELKARAPGETDEERELAFMFSLTQIADRLDFASILLAGIQVDHLPPVEASPPTEPEHVAVSHVDVTPLETETVRETVRETTRTRKS